MERDFMGLNSKDSLIVVKEEAVENPVFSKASAVQWPSSNKVSALPHFMSFQAAQDEKTAKVMSDPFSASAFKNVHFSHDMKMLPVSSSAAVPVSMSNSFFKTHFSGASQSFGGPTMKQQFLGGIPVTAPGSVQPACGSVAGITEPWFNSKPAGAPAQLTIFYGGTVHVYNDISPEKAQAIMFLAGNKASAAPTMAQPRAQVQAAMANTPPCSALSSPISVSSHPMAHSPGATTNNDEVLGAKTTGVSTSPASRVDPPKIAATVGTVATSSMIPSAVPQARKASLARFLEKRKERAMSSAPYSQNNKSLDGRTPECNGVGFSATSGMGTGSISTGK